MSNGADVLILGYRLAGSDTTAISLRAILYFLVRNKSAYKRAQQEVDMADGHGKLSPMITYGECLELPYLLVKHHSNLCSPQHKSNKIQTSGYERSDAMPSWGFLPP